MAREKFPSDDVDRVMVRFPSGMRDRIAEVARANGRSMNAEIVARLAASLEGPQLATNVSLGREQTENLVKAMTDVDEKMIELGGGVRFHFTIVPEEYMDANPHSVKNEKSAHPAKSRSKKST